MAEWFTSGTIGLMPIVLPVAAASSEAKEAAEAMLLKDHGTPNLPHISVDLIRPRVTHIAVNEALSRKRSRKRP